jgi:hypothetical protein
MDLIWLPVSFRKFEPGMALPVLLFTTNKYYDGQGHFLVRAIQKDAALELYFPTKQCDLYC